MNTGDNNQARLRFLLRAYLDNNIGEEELDELTACFRREDRQEEIAAMMEEIWQTMAPGNMYLGSKEKVFHGIVNDPRFHLYRDTVAGHDRPRSRRATPWWAIAATVTIVFGAGLFLLFRTGKDMPQQSVAHTEKRPVSPGRQKAVLTLADGRQMELEDLGNGDVATQGQSVLQQVNGQLIYNDQGDGGTAGPELALENTISTPKGGEFRLTLPDGTNVWLNAASSVTFPVKFSDKERYLKITGEIYLEVRPEPHRPFLVRANGTVIQVLGTKFNVSAYPEDLTVKTTLFSGSVKISKNRQTRLLVPGQQAIVQNNSDAIDVTSVDTEEVMAWKNGYFMFRNEDIKSVMEKAARWYDVDVVYQGDMRGKNFGGTISRFADIDTLMKALEMTGTVHYKIEGRRVIIME